MAGSATHSRLAWIGLAPFLVFVAAFEVLPVLTLLRSSLTGEHGLTFGNFGRAMTPSMLTAFANSLQLALATAVGGTVFGTIVAYAIATSSSPTARYALTALANVTANFGGAPLAFAFVITLGSTGFVTLLLGYLGIHLYPDFRIYSITGLGIAYLYFQMPLAILLVMPALLALRQEWREAAAILGATTVQYWTRVGLPILAPAMLASFFLLFANAFGAYATAWTLTGSDVNLVPVQIAALVRGEVVLDPALADALAVLSLLVMGGCLAAYQHFARRMRRTK
ncbi:putative spermidine/putrescine transport system permease protein [Mesorhizobium soli]|jgi:putative spermidine/putrescine transport system permease protein|uniref:ABC transporter permease n=1 Tax=Pseudaminobacter soli (ex Li et al. 2025) TaxID=1295366 RepID=UPI00247548F5|nr:acriflavin resistance protein [Mesorhizobium soli]MDH6234656.1 putative spermidine/putrescine transport system permease protein [Mesorhizobium soli]